MAYICRIELNGIAPTIWREFHFHPEVTFHQLHEIIQLVMGWEDYHLYAFHVNGQAIGLPDPSFAAMTDRTMLNARKEQVQQHVNKEDMRFAYIYDFGDDWQHAVTLLKIDSSTDLVPVCLGGARGCPPEDVGGVWGYQHMLEALLAPDHPERDELLGWMEEGYDPEHFSCEKTNRKLQRKKNKLVPASQYRRPERAKPVKLTKSALNKHLKQLSADQLVELVKACYGASKEMEKFLAVKILGDEAVESLFHEYRKKVEHEFFPERGVGKLRLQQAKQAIAEFERLTDSAKYSLELKLIYVEMGVSFTQSYGDIDARFYDSMISMYADIIETVDADETAELFGEYGERLGEVVSNSEGIGWDFEEVMHDLYAQLSWSEIDEEDS